MIMGANGAGGVWKPAGKRYLVVPGWVRSRVDGDRHWIGAERLMRLYGVDPAECVISRGGMVGRHELRLLIPRADGRYRESLEELA